MSDEMVYIVIGEGAWGKDPDLKTAKKNMVKQGGSLRRFMAFRCHRDTTVNSVHGGLSYPLEHGEPVVVESKGAK